MSMANSYPTSNNLSMSSSSEKRRAANDPISLKVKAQDESTLWIAIKLDCHMEKLMATYCQKQQRDPNTFTFLSGRNGLRINKRDTPRKLGLNDGDEILAMAHQSGGGSE